jgi:hypothetical protein
MEDFAIVTIVVGVGILIIGAGILMLKLEDIRVICLRISRNVSDLREGK